ncbi:riboflavin biosynthesis protein RibD [Vulcanibacillus modesticaldus]|uniref:Riboflavin biosynthesis protein RibD n=1 Tax=Vulcanibacillus modesticaldus TaxID=337097 RepID=A0A1D2YV45_9BACI|nr:bifunctional diaminohydroxyphosphoribosylaminopyrimidine deaminase/5-amino-6-(5-phosphoribosylamino)uracil reductase RibD [Vulcanibacillus modesticaldus]OEF99557.1 riboflavin biosynthesis protein RibD [Vulcanibacillus modesticaldus]
MNDQYFMQLAIDLAKKTKGQTSPNPVVGAVVVKDGRIIGMGAHLKAGEAHAEVQALNMAGKETKGSTVYVTLEPCSHFGKTPPCAARLVKEQVKRVVVAMLDPNPLVSGNGIKILEDAGIEVDVGVLEAEAKKLNEAFIKYITKRMPFVTVKTAMTLDGKIATYTGSSRWITGELAREYVHQLRHEHDAIMVGSGTIIKDNPSLTTRREVEGLNPLRIIVDSRLSIPLEAKVITDKQAVTWIFTSKKVDRNKQKKIEEFGVKVIVTESEEKVCLVDVLKYLASNHVTSLLVEGGATLIGSLFEQKLVDKYISFIAPKLVGGQEAPSVIAGKGIANMHDALLLDNVTFERFGEDFCITGYPKY